MDVGVGLSGNLSTEELMLLNCSVGEDSWESLDCKEIQLVHPKGDQSWVFIGRTDVEAETPKLNWPPDLAHASDLQMDRFSEIYFAMWIDDQKDWGQA